MGQTWVLLALKIGSLIGSTASTTGFVGIIAFKETLGDYKWQLIVGGFAMIAVCEGLAYLLAKRMQADGGDDPADDGNA